MNQLDILCSPSYWSKRFSSPEEVIQHHLEFIKKESDKIRTDLQGEFNIAYGESKRQKFDIVGTDLESDAPILIFVHGGYWQTKELSRSSYHFISSALHRNGIKTIYVGYDLCPDISLPEIVHQIEKATKQCLHYAKKHNAKGVYFLGHSAGAHLIASLFTGFVTSLTTDLQAFIKGIILISGVFDLEPIQKSVINDLLELNKEVAVTMSPLKQEVQRNDEVAFCIVVGENDSPEFIRQSREFSNKVEEKLYIIDEVDHFNIVEKLMDEEFFLTRLVIDLILKKL